jgi:two-component system, NtrC family, sensor kinase
VPEDLPWMIDYYQIPTLVLLSLLVSVFAGLYLRSRTTRTLLWLIGWLFAIVRIVMELQGMSGPLVAAVGNVSLEMAGVMFLGSMSPLQFGHKHKIYYVVAAAAPLIVFSVLMSVFPHPSLLVRVLLLVNAVATVFIATLWSAEKNVLPIGFTLFFSMAVGTICINFAWRGDYTMVLYLARTGIHVITALLIIWSYRRLSSGVVFSAVGLLLWTAPVVHLSPLTNRLTASIPVGKLSNLMKIMTAVGMIVLVLEEELAINEASRQRDRRARNELEQYAKLDVSVLPGRDQHATYQQMCSVISESSRFRQVLLMLRSVEDNYYVAASAGAEGALVRAIEDLGKRTSSAGIQAYRRSRGVSRELGNTYTVELRPLFLPGDDLERLNFASAHMIPMISQPDHLEGVLVLGALKNPAEKLHADDLLPLELLVARAVAARETNVLMDRVSRSEKLAGLGQLAGGVAHELNNPLTVVMGYAELIEEGAPEGALRRNAGIIRTEAQRMRQIIESLIRFWRPAPRERMAVSIEELLRDIQQLRKPELERLGIVFKLTIVEHLPTVHASTDQIRQVLLQVLNNAVDAVEKAVEEREIRVDVTHDRERMHILISDSGPGFPNPSRIFDPFYTTKQPGEGPGLGLSICYSIIREHGGEISAYNLYPHGGAVMIEMPLTSLPSSRPMSGEAIVH